MARIRCTEVNFFCPVEATTLGYYPNLGANAFFCAAFGLCAIGTIVIGIWKRTWTFTLAVGAGLILETVGYASRIQMYYNPWSESFKTQLVCIILAPTLLCAGIYLTLKHVARAVGPTLSRIRPRLYPWIFLPFDIFCLCLQAIGGGIDAAATANPDNVNFGMLDVGNGIIIAGIVLQVVNLAVFGALSADFFYAAWKHFRSTSPSDGDEDPGRQIWTARRFRIFCSSIAAAYVGILARCIYRIAEMAGGWGNPIMRDEISYIILEATLVLYASILLTIFAPGLFFPEMGSGPASKIAEKHADQESVSRNENENPSGSEATPGVAGAKRQ
ncbi:hypothetical protein VTN31DRAFT_5550 [Thermomyces dupontii]|uniref:uncharacterized protein n=1 Tax=Talaromyces thermophilus TaxID=28565 RepID=UPI0037424BB5